MPAKSAAQFGMALAVMSGKSKAMPRNVASEIVRKTPHKMKVRFGKALARKGKRK